MSANMDDKFKVDIREAVADIMSAKEDAERVHAVESLLQDSQNAITELTDAVKSKDLELAASSEEVISLRDKIEELELKAAEFQATLAESKQETVEVTERASVAEGKLADIAADASQAARMGELEEAKVALSGEKRPAQEEKVRGMGEEEFASYKEERIEFRAQLEAELKEAASAAEDLKGPISDEAVNAEGAIVTLNVETASETLTEKYRNFGKHLAASMLEDKE